MKFGKQQARNCSKLKRNPACLSKDRGTNSFWCAWDCSNFSTEIPHPRSPSHSGQIGWLVILGKKRRFSLLQPEGNSGRIRIEGPVKKVSRWRADFRSCILLVSSRLIDVVAGGYLQEASRWLRHLAESLDVTHSC